MWSDDSDAAVARNLPPQAHVREGMEAVMTGVGLGTVHEVSLTPETQAQFELMRRCQADATGAFEELVLRFQPRVKSIVRGILRQSNDTEDVCQQVFTKVFISLKKFDFRSAVATWIYKIAVNECYDHIRKQKVRKAVLLADLSEEEQAWVENMDVVGAAGRAGPAQQAEFRELTEKLLALVSHEDRTLLVLKEMEGYSVQELAAILGLNENTVKVRLFRARQKLLAAMKRKKL